MRKANNDLHHYLSHPYYYPGSMEDKKQEQALTKLYDVTLRNYIDKQVNVIETWRNELHPGIDGNDLLLRIQAMYMVWFNIECPNQKILELTHNSENKPKI